MFDSIWELPRSILSTQFDTNFQIELPRSTLNLKISIKLLRVDHPLVHPLCWWSPWICHTRHNLSQRGTRVRAALTQSKIQYWNVIFEESILQIVLVCIFSHFLPGSQMGNPTVMRVTKQHVLCICGILCSDVQILNLSPDISSSGVIELNSSSQCLENVLSS